MLGTNAMMDATDITFDIGDQSMDPWQDLRGLLPRTGHQPLMLEGGGSVQEAIALPAIGLDHSLDCQALLHQVLNLCAADVGYHPHGGKSVLFFSAGVSTATTTFALPVAPRPRLPGLGGPK